MRQLFDLFDLDKLYRRRDCQAFMASSYDREGGNFDMGNFEMVFAGEAILLDVVGSGCITRMWSANPTGQLKIYFDGRNEPTINEPFEDFLKRMPFSFGHGKVNRDQPEFPAIIKAHEPLGYTTYAVLPFQKGCRITLTSERLLCYYQINYLMLNTSQSLPTLSTDSWTKWTAENKAIEQYLQTFSSDLMPGRNMTGSLIHNGVLSLEPGQRSVIFDVQGSHLIRRLRFNVEYPKGVPVQRKVTEPRWLDNEPVPSDSAATRHAKDSLEIRACWDEELPAIRSPLAHFFMDFGAFEQYRTLFVNKQGQEYSCRWPMPFRKLAVIELRNNACVGIEKIQYEIEYEPVSTFPKDMFHFHARSHAERPTFGYEMSDYRRDVVYTRNHTGELNYPILRTWGQGHFIGCCFNVDYSEAPLANCMVESDEAVFVDDDPCRTMWGTGTEDYLNDAWGVHPVVGILSGGRTTDGNIFGYRFHLPDAIPFEKKLFFTLERGSSNNCSASYKSVAYYYRNPIWLATASRCDEQPTEHRCGRRYFSP
jgi:hypothetical protein